MRWLFFWRRAEPQRARVVEVTRPQPIPEPRERPLFLDEASERPVDLHQEIEAVPEDSDLVWTLRAEVHRLASRAAHDAERELLRGLDRSLEGESLPLPPMPQVILRVQQRSIPGNSMLRTWRGISNWIRP